MRDADPATHVGSASHDPIVAQKRSIRVGLTYLIGPLRKELSMFFELVAFVPSICFDKLIEEFKPPAVEWVLAWLRSTRL